MTKSEVTTATMSPHSSFEAVKSHYVESLNVRLEHYRHKKTGADHFHLASDHEENIFMVTLRTMPKDSSGVAHILEHTALCGSEKYPVRDPFFMMTRRSLNTFMNAMTSSDWTAYPFASENKKDYENLLDVYLDAVFFSRLDELDFLQEGHRLEFEEPTNTESPLVYKGVVYNEMKGAMSSPVSQIYQSLKHYLFPNNTYHFNSGGDPECIPDLTYDDLLSFYKTHYHPSNASFFTFGNRSAEDIQQRIDEKALNRFDALNEKLSVPLEKRFNRELRVEDAYAFEGDSVENKTYLSMGWLLGESTDLYAQLEAHLLSDLLFDNSATPLRKALETCEFGTNPSPLCGLDDSNREMVFLCGLEGSEPKHQQDFEQLVLNTLKEVAENGVPQESIDAMLHQLELSQREITGDGYPYGLQLILSLTGAATHGGSVMDALDIDAALEKLRIKSKSPDYIPELVNKLLLQNVHRVTLTMRPDAKLVERQTNNERLRLEAIEDSLTEAEKKAIVEQASALKVRQEQPDDGDILPKVILADVKPDVKTLAPIKEMPIVQYGAGTNGIAYQQLYWALPVLSKEEQILLPIYTSLLTELGSGDKSYLDLQNWQAARTGSVHLYSMYKPSLTDLDSINGYLIFSGKSLVRHADELTDIMASHWLEPRFDEVDRILDYLTLMSSRRSQGITGSGHSLAMQAASSAQSVGSAFVYNSSGLPAIARLKQWVEQWKQSPEQLTQWLQGLYALHKKLSSLTPHALLVAEKDELPVLEAHLLQSKFKLTAEPSISVQPAEVNSHSKIVWSTSTQVNFCAAAFKTVAPTHEDSAPLTVLAGVLRNNYLHRTIREQGGAYGGGASHDNSNGVFRFYSYRDPRLEETLKDFNASIEWLAQGDFTSEKVEESILGVVSSMDKPGSPAGEAKIAYQNRLFARSDDFRREYREQLLNVNKQQLVDLAGKYLTSDNASHAVITNGEQAEVLADKGFNWQKI
ncbi:insulinase family protein [Reinekea marina]|uniref:Insulinase family protein n=1 Tax=Reinekea marina TaxID=1310421 RepID=A0ABV7WP08_9GAMM|nr:insulinase family protein [Reinekea marina]MDN3649463.1 insulinase family protein [Reinekea marina]